MLSLFFYAYSCQNVGFSFEKLLNWAIFRNGIFFDTFGISELI